jgi:hypothetical protein
MRLLSITVILSFFFLHNLNAEDLNATDSSTYTGGWFGLGIGSNYFGLSSHYYFCFIYNGNIFSIRYLNSHDLQFSPGGGPYDNPDLSIQEKGFLYGRCYKKEYLLLSISAGIGYISGSDRGRKIADHQYEQVNISTYGIPFEAKFRLNIGFIGFGGGWFGNINPQKFLSGGMIEISIGVY